MTVLDFVAIVIIGGLVIFIVNEITAFLKGKK